MGFATVLTPLLLLNIIVLLHIQSKSDQRYSVVMDGNNFIFGQSFWHVSYNTCMFISLLAMSSYALSSYGDSICYNGWDFVYCRCKDCFSFEPFLMDILLSNWINVCPMIFAFVFLITFSLLWFVHI